LLLCIAKSGTTVAASQVWALPDDVAPPNAVSMVAGVQNTASKIGGVLFDPPPGEPLAQVAWISGYATL